MNKSVHIASLHIALVICLSFSSPAQPSLNANIEAAKKAISISNQRYFQAFAKGDSSIFISCYTEDCWIMPPNARTLCGVEAPLDYFQIAYYQLGLRNGKFITIDVFGDGLEFVTEEGFWQTFDANNKLLDNGKFLVLWKKTPQGWKRFRDFFSSDRDK